MYCIFFFFLFQVSNDDTWVDNINDELKDSNALHVILREKFMSTTDKRNTWMAKFFDVRPVRNIPISTAVGGKVSHFVYISPEDSLTRYLGCKIVFAQFLSSGKRNTMYDHIDQAWHGDFYQSDAYKNILRTLPEDSGPYPPLLLKIYR